MQITRTMINTGQVNWHHYAHVKEARELWELTDDMMAKRLAYCAIDRSVTGYTIADITWMRVRKRLSQIEGAG